ncbi:MAG: tyrosine-type recombinase/integrase [Acetobacteraceae bacterium]|nr:tyrosine-type recombinase/integrase [Acetobacteraceae bacterium]
MTTDLIISSSASLVPSQIATAGKAAGKRFIEFFTANIRNPNTRAAYLRAVSDFFRWTDRVGLSRLEMIEPVHVAAYIEELGRNHSAPSVKQHLAAVRMLFDWLVLGQIVKGNPASVVRGPKHVVKRGKTPVLSPEEARLLFDSIRTDTIVGLRDRAFIGVLIYSFARVSAAVSMQVSDYFPQGKRWWLRLHEKGGKHHEMPVHHSLEEYLDAYITAAGIGTEPKSPLFRSANRKTGTLTEHALDRRNAYHLVVRKARQAGIRTKIGCHTFRATGITIYLTNGGDLEKAQQMAAHESPRTTKLYDRRADVVSLDEVEKVVF